MSHKWFTLLALSGATVLSMSLWFSATAVTPSLRLHWHLNDVQIAWLTMTVQIGFVFGALGSALLNLSDRVSARFLFAAGSLTGAVLNGLIPLVDPGFAGALVCRFVTGAACALIYPTGMKIMATWTREDRGLGLGLLVGAVVVGSASPHLIRALGGESWRVVILASSGAALLGGLIAALFAVNGPYATAAPRFRWKHMSRSWFDRPLRLANLGYLGHMWELYAMWTWIPAYLFASFVAYGDPGDEELGWWQACASAIAFAAIAAGGLGSFLAGLIADRVGRTQVTIVSLIISGGCAATIGFFFGSAPWVVGAIAVIWGFAVVADSAQFSSCVSELSDREYVGTQLTTQTAMGFLLTLTTIQMVPTFVQVVDWRWAFLPLVIGPAVGIYAMIALRRSPARSRLAGGRG